MKDGGDLVKEEFEFCSTCELDMSRTEELEYMFDVWCRSRGVREGFAVLCLYRGTGVLEVGSEETLSTREMSSLWRSGPKERLKEGDLEREMAPGKNLCNVCNM